MAFPRTALFAGMPKEACHGYQVVSPSRSFLYGAVMFLALAAPSEGQAWSYGYNYGHYSGHHYYGYSNRYYPERHAYSTTARTYQQGSDFTAERGWAQLRNNHSSETLTTFGQLAEASPSKGVPKAGYALASAKLGRLGHAPRIAHRPGFFSLCHD